MKFQFTQTLDFDVEKERNRINKCFEGKIKDKLLLILDLFCNEEYQKCLDLIHSLGYSEKDECPESEFLSEFIYDTYQKIGFEGWLVKKLE